MSSTGRSVSRLAFALLVAFTIAWAINPVSAAYCETDCGGDCYVWCNTNECGGGGSNGCGATDEGCVLVCGDLPSIIRECEDYC